ncbi:hypothetical protein GUITHDRAFT_103286 [Guillardia theta CCMP2712]|uniref:Uncharacterized protein n=1 Tax=Guillardia theta (strain CCMP2712) TaxID=905079 RepID=L1JQX8_GUITC|nr:hypothetical protein GUITHDRAFT_103286 [Guillardia theta CCMP2712]EKX50694.1 hypothetical protein GUITHDRAFT_103286 [Guillardia theta CCMP2712]|eukprot:XP_005837674.1 hypothetical protein GUITHDRAFT_103286 [Guillardia theta CCMP2712]
MEALSNNGDNKFIGKLLNTAMKPQVDKYAADASLPLSALSTDQWIHPGYEDRQSIQTQLALASSKLYNGTESEAQPNRNLYLFQKLHPNQQYNSSDKKALAISYVNRCIEIIMFWDKDLTQTPNSTHVPTRDYINNMVDTLSTNNDIFISVHCAIDQPLRSVFNYTIATQKHTKLYTIIALTLTAVRRAEQQPDTILSLYKFLFLLINEHIVRPHMSGLNFNFKNLFDLQ